MMHGVQGERENDEAIECKGNAEKMEEKKFSTPKYDLNVKEGKEKENLGAPKHALVSAAAFCLSAKEA